jgi:hypothetical protein
MGVDQYITSGCDRFVGWVTTLGKVINVDIVELALRHQN